MLGIIARGDNSGLAIQTWEMARHTRPAKVLLVHQTANVRGPCHPDRYADLGAEVTTAYLHPGQRLSDLDLKVWLEGLGCVYTAESDYGANLATLCARRLIHLVVHANPELWNERYRGATTTVVTPTDWELQRIQDARHMAMPVDRARLPWRQRTDARVFWHPSAHAFHDRHGTALFMRTLERAMLPGSEVILTGTPVGEHVEIGGRIYCAGDSFAVGRTKVRVHGPRVNYWDLYDDVDVLVLPRRYGGLSLPTQEALSAGVPVIMLDTGPYAGRGGVLTVQTTSAYEAPMKGGAFGVYDTDPQLLADEMRALVDDPGLVRRASIAADDTAASLDWRGWQGLWQGLLA